ncbi:hypothetical protein [Luteolibacter soli]|uniref:DUF2752 domain-containing protein n=1 Tax=Luteolibacter soli TaxID=3135280 RepID=A0ABU9AXN3_9BACT
MKSCCQRLKSRSLAGWLLPGGLLVLMPKCPFCLAGYVTIFTGAGLSLAVARGLQATVIACFIISLLVFSRALLARKDGHTRSSRNP